MRIISALLLLLTLVGAGFAAAGPTTTIDVTNAKATSQPASFTTTSSTDKIHVVVGTKSKRLAYLNSTNDWYYIDPETSVQKKVFKDQELRLTYTSTTDFQVTRVSADGTVVVQVLE